jgi:putative phosphoesterase
VRLALLSDVHSNIHALQAVLEDVESQGADRLASLGDMVGYNAHPNHCVEALRKADAIAVLGNHDWASTTGQPEGFNAYAVAGVEYSRRKLSEENKAWLQALPERRVERWGPVSVCMAHGSPRAPLTEYLFPSTDARELRDQAKAAGKPSVIALGHTHWPMRIEAGSLFLNPGSVGQPRDGDSRASYCILDTASLSTDFRRVAYDVEAAARDVREAGLPDVLAERLFVGR